MLISTEIEVRWNYNNKEHFINKGYNFTKCTDIFVAKIEDLNETNNSKILYECDYCHEIISTDYKNYIKSKNKSIIQKDCCKKCKPIKTKEQTMIKHGVESTNQLESTQIKKRQTNLIRYGHEHVSQVPEFQEKIKITSMKIYGVERPSQSEIVKENTKKTFKEKYGVDNILSLKETKDKIKQTNLERYNTEFPMQNENVKNKTINTNLDRYGVRSTSQIPEVRIKQKKSLYKNNTARTSIQQIYLSNLYKGDLNYVIGMVNVDIFLDNDIVVEYDGGGHNLNVKKGNITQQEFNNKERKREIFIRSKGYKIIRIISSKDKLPLDDTLLPMLEYAKDYLSTGRSWIYFDIDNHKINTSQYVININYGKLRKIKNKDIDKIA